MFVVLDVDELADDYGGFCRTVQLYCSSVTQSCQLGLTDPHHHLLLSLAASNPLYFKKILTTSAKGKFIRQKPLFLCFWTSVTVQVCP